MVTTDHISPAGNIQKDSPTGRIFHGTSSTYRKIIILMDARRGNHEVMMRGTFANIRIRE